MANGADLQNWVKEISVKLTGMSESLVRVETHLDQGHMKQAEQETDIEDLKKMVQSLKEVNAFMRGQIHMIMLIGGALVGIGVILQAVATFERMNLNTSDRAVGCLYGTHGFRPAETKGLWGVVITSTPHL